MATTTARWQERAKDAERKLRAITKLLDKYSLHGAVPCDDLDAVLDGDDPT